MATTAKGYPYPVGTDRVADGDNAIQALAEAVDTKLGVGAAGVASVNVNALNTPASVAVTFPAGRFTGTPVVTLGLQSGTPNTNMCGVAGISNTGCTIYAARTAGGVPVSQLVCWIAHG